MHVCGGTISKLWYLETIMRYVIDFSHRYLEKEDKIRVFNKKYTV